MTAPSGEGTRYRAVAASVRGSSHERDGRPNQDAAAIESGEGVEVVVAISDGHGSRECFRSDLGARIAVETATELGALVLGSVLRQPAGSSERPIVEFAAGLTIEWAERVRAHLSSNPATDEELAGFAGGRAQHEADPLRAYGATLLFVAIANDRALLLQLGDGDIIAANAAGEVFSPIARDPSLVGGETRSLCLPNAAAYVNHAVHDLAAEPVGFILLATDGYGNAFAEEDWRVVVGNDFGQHLREHSLDWVNDRLPTWLAASAKIGGDDVTVALVVPTEPAPTAVR